MDLGKAKIGKQCASALPCWSLKVCDDRYCLSYAVQGMVGSAGFEFCQIQTGKSQTKCQLLESAQPILAKTQSIKVRIKKH